MSVRRNEQGQATVLLVLSSLVLLGMAALVLDVGSWFQAKRQTQSAADAAALAAAQALPEDGTTARTRAAAYVTANGGGTTTVGLGTSFLPDDTVTVTVARDAPGFFARVFGIDTVQIRARAAARAGNPDIVRWAAPFAVDELHPFLQCKPSPCFGMNTRLDLDKVGPGAFRLINIDGSRGGIGQTILEEWILRGYDGEMPRGWYFSDPGTKYNAAKIDRAMKLRLGEELLFPVYRTTRASGANFEYDVIGWVGFLLSDYRFKGSKLSWLDGSFTRVMWTGIQGSGGGANFGVRSIQLIE